MSLSERNLKSLVDVSREHGERLFALTQRLDAMHATIAMLVEKVARLEAEKTAAFARSRGNGPTAGG